ncbi:MAG: Mur ligase family protein [Nitrospirota bacterium]|jgi:dihydrofolate synthase/folylpolyglutamate synthase
MVLAPTSDALSFLDGLQPSRMVFDLHGFEALLAAIGDPQLAFPAIHVAGTNGKGSVCAIAEAVLRASGLHTGRYTSPHLDHPGERITLDGAALETAAFASAVRALRDLIARRAPSTPYTYFDFLTALAFQQFAARAVDVAVVETGLGGRLDSTRPCRPRVTCITPISRDHTEILGEDLTVIASEKAGILRPGVPCIIGPQPAAVTQMLSARADEIGSPMVVFGRDFSAEAIAPGETDRRIVYHPLRGAPMELTVPLAGAHQVANAACALGSVELFVGAPLDPMTVTLGLAGVSWPGRCEWLGDNRFLLDGAHNVASARALGRYLADCGRSVHLVWGMLRGKDPEGFLSALRVPLAGATLPRLADPRAIPPDELVAYVQETPIDAVGESVTSLVPRLRRCLPATTVVCVTGSLTLVGEARRVLAAATQFPVV